MSPETTRCPDCGEACDPDDLATAEGFGSLLISQLPPGICNFCAEYYRLCADCSRAVPEDFIRIDEASGDKLCESCAEERAAERDWRAEESAVYRRSVGLSFGRG